MYGNANFLLNLCYVAKKLERTSRSNLKKVTYIIDLKYLIFWCIISNIKRYTIVHKTYIPQTPKGRSLKIEDKKYLDTQ